MSMPKNKRNTLVGLSIMNQETKLFDRKACCHIRFSPCSKERNGLLTLEGKRSALF